MVWRHVPRARKSSGSATPSRPSTTSSSCCSAVSEKGASAMKDPNRHSLTDNLAQGLIDKASLHFSFLDLLDTVFELRFVVLGFGMGSGLWRGLFDKLSHKLWLFMDKANSTRTAMNDYLRCNMARLLSGIYITMLSVRSHRRGSRDQS